MKKKITDHISGKYLSLGLMLFIVGAALIVLYMTMNRYESFTGMLNKGLTIISPFIYGIVIAYLLNPIFDFFTKNIYRWLKGKVRVRNLPDASLTLSKAISTVITLTLFILFITAFGFLVVPQIVDSLTSLAEILPARVAEIIAFIQNAEAGNSSPLLGSAVEWLQNSTDNIISWINNTVLPRIGNYMSQIYEGVWGTVKTLMNILIGVITSVYLMNGRAHFEAAIKKTIRALFDEERAEGVLGFVAFSNKAFGGFISGKIIDSIIIGFICAALMTLLNLPYVVLVSVIIGVTNIIPFFGPFIGAVPGALIIAAADPMKMLVFLVMIFALQQFDGYVLGPKILGDSTGLSSFWVMFSIIIGGGMFGFLGMVFAVPTFAVIYYYFRKHVETSLAEKGLPTATSAYETKETGTKRKKRKASEMDKQKTGEEDRQRVGEVDKRMTSGEDK